MARLVKQLRRNRKVVFDTGRFDEWCVYVVESTGWKKAPHDVTYFHELYILSKKYPRDKVYNDFVKIYHGTSKELNPQTLTLIDELVETYREVDKDIVEQWFTVLYAGMIAEENKKDVILKKRIKKLGMHQVFKLGMPAAVAAKFSIGRKWRELDAIMRELGF